MLKKKIIPIIVIILVLIVGVAIFRGKKTNTVAAATPNKASVKVSQVNNVAKDSTISLKASLEASEVGIVSGKIGGKVVQVMFENGKYVSQGDTLIKLDDQDIKNNIVYSESKLISLQISLGKMQTSMENAQRSFNRTKELFDQGAISKVDLETAETTLKNAKDDLELTKANINTAQIELKNLKDSLANTIITAPISGLMDEKGVNLGQYANMGVILGKVKNISPIYAVIEVDQNDLSSFKVGQSAKVKIGSNDLKEYDGMIKTIEVSADTSSRVFECKVQVDNQDQSLKPGIYANVDIIGNQKGETLAVPTDALSGTQGDYTVFVNDNGTARKHIVSIGEITKALVEIKSGIQKGDSVIITNVNTLQDGDAVSVVTE